MKLISCFCFPVGPTPGDQKPGSRASPEKVSGERGTSPTPHTLVSVPNRDEDLDGRGSFSRLGRLADKDEVLGSNGMGGGLDSRASKASSKKSRAVSLTSKGRSDQTGTPGTSKPKSATSLGTHIISSMKHCITVI